MNSFERNAYQGGYRWIAGSDEAGRGPLAGPVVAAAVILPHEYYNPEINDSKQLSPQKREKLYGVISEDALSIGLGVVEAPVIDDVNILRATLMAMQEAFTELSPIPDLLLIDGIHSLPLAIPQRTKIKGYGTEEHRAAIRKFGLCKIHRRSFRMDGPVKPAESYDLFAQYDQAL